MSRGFVFPVLQQLNYSVILVQWVYCLLVKSLDEVALNANDQSLGSPTFI